MYQVFNRNLQTSDESERPQIGIESIVIKMLIDKNRTPEERDLLTNIAFYTGKLNKVRGDRVDLQEMSFPASTLQIQREQQKAEQEKQIQELEKEKQDAELRAAQKPANDATLAKQQESIYEPHDLVVACSRRSWFDSYRCPSYQGERRSSAERPMSIQQAGQGEESQIVSAQQAMAESNAEYQEAIEVDKVRSNLIVTCAGRIGFDIARDPRFNRGRKSKR